ncbi:CbiX/SirB N-terminal domain-containing protein [Aquisalimonas lutea]|uniref:sirohydrochlorin chelatase n=1 Tax=Aquisalimonas lutea TaxID=1327750 RepID=UPI0025B2ADC3|nr:CbiX/SirB N-terminal domain-containing protein [Aquisalimonas lutea]MDN3517865.1 CbiX/SirB N-terminal domain-containing protein [Aquisalimonas lutea]
MAADASRRRIFLVDNGSLRPSSTLNLRRVAAALSDRCGVTVEPVSLLHSNKVPAEELDGEAARTFGPAATRAAQDGAEEIVVVPFFFGPSRALTGYLPERVATLREHHPELAVRVARPLVDLYGPVDLRLARALRDGVLDTVEDGTNPAVALVDHGSPIPEVTAVRNVLAGQLGALLEGRVARVAPASMERRDGDDYRFNEPLLESLLDEPGFNQGPVVVAMLFLSPGRHAGPDGDVAAICTAAEGRNPGLTTRMTPLAGEHEAVLDVLADRLTAARAGDGLLLSVTP